MTSSCQRKTYTMSKEQLDKILEVCKPVPYMIIDPISPQKKADEAWEKLGEEMGFDYMTVKPVAGQPETVFTAEEK